MLMLRWLGVLAGVIVPGRNGSQMIITKFNTIGLGVFGVTNLRVHAIYAYQSVNRLNSII
jgi:hypothetical protein